MIYSLNIGLTNRCNSRCVFCPISKTKITREDMPLNLAKKIIDETIDEIEHHISLDLFGESLLYKDLVEVVRYIKEKRNIEVVLYTNAFTLDDQLLMELEQAGLDRITISLDAYGRDEFLRIKGVDKYINIVTNLYRFARRNIKIIVQFADLRYNSPKKKRNKITDIIRRLGFQVRNSRYISWCGEVPWLSDTPRKIREPKPCAYLFHYMNIASNGDMVMCCLDYNHKHTFGNVKRSKVMTVWNSKKAQALREKHMRGELPDMCLKCENEFYLDRDENAAKNILNEGLKIISAGTGDNTGGDLNQTSFEKHRSVNPEAHLSLANG